MHRLVLFCSLLLAACTAHGSLPRSGTTAAHELLAFHALLRDVHPDLHRFVAEATLTALVEAEAETLRGIAAPTPFEVTRAYTRVVAAVHDAHMITGLPEDVSIDSVLPLEVEIIGDEVYVDACTVPFTRGSTLVAIDGTPTASILATLSELAVYEGMNTAARTRALRDDFGRLYLIAYGARDAYTVTWRTPAGVEVTFTLAGVYAGTLRFERLSNGLRRANDVNGLPLVNLDHEPGPRYLSLPSFSGPDRGMFAQRLEEAASSLETATELVIDLRGNEGGFRDRGALLLDHLATSPYVLWQRTGVRVRAVPGRYEDLLEPAFGVPTDFLRDHPRERTGELHVREGDPLAATFVPRTPHITAKLVVLVDARVNSAANEFALALRAIRPDAVFVGEEIGGECERHVGEVPVQYTSPTFGVRVLLSLVRIEHVAVAGCVLGHGLMPDVPVVYAREHFIDDVDPYRAAALAAFE
jgi:hypothetical protein